MSDMKAYLAAKYMSGPKADAILARSTDPSLKKLKRKKPKNEDYIGGAPSKLGESSTSGLQLRDEDEWKKNHDMDIDDEDAPIIGKSLATFQKSKSAWATVGSTSLAIPSNVKSEPTNDVEVKAEPEEPEASVAPVQVTKRKGGLRTAKQLREEEERMAAERSPSPPPPGGENGGPGDHTRTVHRDATGRILDVEKLKAEEKQREEDERRKKREKEEWTKGFTQRQAREDQARLERELANQDVGRSAGDVAMNREMRETERWNDPAAEFLSKKKKSKGPRRPKYQGSWAPNRFFIAPGFRWDGVDRSNGFEKKYFQYQNAASRKQFEEAAWSMEDM